MDLRNVWIWETQVTTMKSELNEEWTHYNELNLTWINCVWTKDIFTIPFVVLYKYYDHIRVKVNERKTNVWTLKTRKTRLEKLSNGLFFIISMSTDFTFSINDHHSLKSSLPRSYLKYRDPVPLKKRNHSTNRGYEQGGERPWYESDVIISLSW